MNEVQVSRLLRAIQDSAERQIPEDDAVQSYGEDALNEAVTSDLVGVDEGSFWRVERVVYLTRAGKAALRGERVVPLRRTVGLVSWLRHVFVAGRIGSAA